MRSNVLISMILILLSTSWVYSIEQNELFDNLYVDRITSNFNGSVSNGSSILVYGDGGIIMRSTDLGKNWEKITIIDSLSIVGMLTQGNSYIGLTSSRWAIKSDDDGKSWNFIDIGNYKFYQLLNYSNNFIALTENKVIVLNSSLSKIREYTYFTDGSYFNATISGNKIFCSSGFGKITIINLDDGTNTVLYLSDFGICSNCPLVRNLQADSKNNIFFSLDKYLIVFNYQKSKMDTLVFLTRDLNFSSYTVFNDEIYYIYTRQILSTKDSLFFLKIDQQNKKYSRINTGETDRYISNISFKHLNFINQNTLIAVGKNNLIYMSFNGGIHWELKSFFGNIDYVNFFDEGEARAIGPNGTFYYSSNKGTTWLPTRDYFKQFYNNPKFNYVSTYNGFLFFKDKNNGIVFYPTDYEGEINTIITNDGGKTLKIKSTTKAINGSLKTFAIENQNKYLFFQYGCLPWNMGCWSSFRLFNDNLELEWDNAIRGTQMFYVAKYSNRIYSLAKDTSEPTNVYSVYYTQDDGRNWVKDFNFQIEESLSLNCMNAILIDNSIYASWDKIKIVNKDTLSIASCYKIDLEQKSAKKIIEARSNNFPDFFKIKNYYFYSASYFVIDNNQNPSIVSNLFFTNDISNDDIVWNIVKFKDISFSRLWNIIDDSVYIFSVYDNTNQNTVLFFGKIKDPTNINEFENDEQQINKIYISNAKPNPATENVAFNIYWDQRLDIDKSDFAVSNILGIDMLIKNQLQLTKKNNYTGELFINTSTLPSGIYFLTINISGESYSKVFVVVK